MKITAFLFLLSALLPASATAATMTFSGLTSEHDVWTEDGITATGLDGATASVLRGEVGHLDDGSTQFATTIEFTMAGDFSANAFDLIPLGQSAIDCNPDLRSCAFPFTDAVWDNVVVEGWKDGVLVASDSFWMGETASTYSFDSSFSLLDTLLIKNLRLPEGADFYCLIDYCSHFNIDNVQLTVVPLPAALPLFASGAVGLWVFLFRRGRKRKNTPI
ncbi:hypothetical protein GCM10007924_24920 [Sneathiella chinensis]|uniref:Secreted protein n=2 Tax=Sneathiella chinensis TaxID=349750 RepID=A0ABQ5U9T5_9PROT|nr:hypothetical protein GCM10007924_24920 [Sneathiella chinensis]